MPSLKHNERLVYVTPAGVQYPLHAPPWRAVLSEEGFGTPPLDYVTDRAPFQHGDTVRAVYLGPRPIQIVVIHNYCSRAEYWAGRQDFLNTIRPNPSDAPPAPGKLLYYLPNRQRRQLDVLLDSGPGFTAPAGGWRELSFTEALRFTAHDPTWYDPTMRDESFVFGGGASQLTFPITFPIYFDDVALNTFIVYAGTWMSYPTIVVTGPVTGFSITNNVTGDRIGLDVSVPAGMSVTIVLNGIKSITRSDGLNMLNALSSDSDLTTFSLVPAPTAPNGTNTLVISGSGTSSASRVELQWYERFFGI